LVVTVLNLNVVTTNRVHVIPWFLPLDNNSTITVFSDCNDRRIWRLAISSNGQTFRVIRIAEVIFRTTTEHIICARLKATD
jgi:hypothetical protein